MYNCIRIDRDHRYFRVDNKNLIFSCFNNKL